jgi:glycosyltransferase involved in cell wall biosynthesis
LARIPNARFTIVGSGPEEARLKADALAWKINDSVDFISWLPQNNLFELYNSHDLLLFPSLHDSSGGVVLEALCHGMPVICLDLGGPKDIVTANSGIIIKTTTLTTTQVASSIAHEIFNVLESPTTLAQLSSGAISRASEFILPNRVARFYQEALRFIEGNGPCSIPPAAKSGVPMAPFPADGA